ncbi:MAG TPA: hypothetical protein VF711_09655, partial [Acidimicrobiales bacterium]
MDKLSITRYRPSDGRKSQSACSASRDPVHKGAIRVVTNKVVIGTAPDSWGIWFAEDPNQTPADRFLDEVVQAGYEWIEIGAYGYLPTDPAKLRDDLSSRRLKVSGGTTFARLQHPGTIDQVWAQVAPIASLTAAMG